MLSLCRVEGLLNTLHQVLAQASQQACCVIVQLWKQLPIEHGQKLTETLTVPFLPQTGTTMLHVFAHDMLRK